MGERNYLIEGVSGTGKTSVCRELQRRGYHAIIGDRELAYQGDPVTGLPMNGVALCDDEDRVRFISERHIWDVDKVKALVAEQNEAITFFCGGSRNFSVFVNLFDGVFVLDIDADTLNRRLDERSEDEWGGRGRRKVRELIVRLHQTKEDIPKDGIVIDATRPLVCVVDEIIRQTKL